MKKCLVTGASGNLGRVVVRRMADDYSALGIGHLNIHRPMIALDIRDSDVFGGFLRQSAPDIVVHCAAYRDPDFCETHPEETRRLNVGPVQALCENLLPTSRLVFISTDYVFDGQNPPYREDSPPQPLNVYGQSKQEAEDFVRTRPNSVILRIPLLIGAGPDWASSGFIAQAVHNARATGRVVVDDVLIRFPTWTHDVAEAIAFLLAKEVEGVFHMSGPAGKTRFAWTIETAEILGISPSHLEPSKTPIPRPAARPRDSQLATDKIRSLGFGHFTEFRTVVEAVMKSFESPA